MDRNVVAIGLFSVLAVCSGGVALSLQPLPGTLADVRGWGQLATSVLFIGSLLAVGGLLWRDRVDGLVVEQFGTMLAGFGSLFYGAALIINASYPNSALAMGMSFGIAAMCAVRWVQIERFVRRAKPRRKEHGDR